MAFFYQYRDLREHVKHRINPHLPRNGKSSMNYSGLSSGEPIRDLKELIYGDEFPDISVKTDHSGSEYFEVTWEPKDRFNPHNWTTTRRIFATLAVCLIALSTTMASSIDAAVVSEAANEFGVSETAESLATGLYLIGFGVGALVASPLSEMVGRFPVYLGTLIIFGCWILGAALAPNFGAQLAFRFLAGLMGTAPLTVAGGSVGDLWNPVERTFGFPIFAVPAFSGPILGMSAICFDLRSNLIWSRPCRRSLRWL